MSYPYADILTKPVQIQEIVNYLDKLEFGEKSKDKNSDGQNRVSRISEYKKLVDEGNITGILAKLVKEQDLLLEKGNKGEIESFYAIFSTLSKSVPSQELIALVIENLTKRTDSKKIERLSALSHLYNYYNDASVRINILIAILDYSQQSDQCSAVGSLIESLDSRLRELNPDNLQKRRIYKALLNFLDSVDWTSTFLLDIWVKYFSTFSSNEKIPAEVSQEAKKTALYLLKDEQKLSLDMILETPVFQSIKNTTEYALLVIFSEKDYKDYVAYYKKNQKAVDALGLNHSDLENKIRLLTLTSLASTQKHITFSEIAKLIEIPENEVEYFVIEAITSEFISAKIDQVNSSVIVRHAEARSFNNEWQNLDKKVEKWKSNIENLLSVVQSVKENRKNHN